MAHELLCMFDAGVRRRQRRLEYVQRLASKLESSMQIADLNKADTKIQTWNAYVRMVLRQHAPPKLKRLLLHHKSILVPPKSRVRGSEIAHCST